MRFRLGIAVAVLILMLGMLTVSPVLAADCVAYLYDRLCVWDWGCWINPLTPNGQYWMYQYCLHPDGTLTQVDHWPVGGCCTP